MSAISAYFDEIERLISRIRKEELPELSRASALFSDAILTNQRIFLFGTGHSHLLSEELFYRAGGLANIHPILEPPLMLHESASQSTLLERSPGYAEKLFREYGIRKNDVMVIISNSGRNGVVVDMALLCRENGVHVIALTSLAHSRLGASRHPSEKKLFELAEVVLDNCGIAGDACIAVPGMPGKVAATSTVIGALLLEAVAAGAVENCREKGVTPDCFLSSNLDGGDAWNEKLVEKYRAEVKHL